MNKKVVKIRGEKMLNMKEKEKEEKKEKKEKEKKHFWTEKRPFSKCCNFFSRRNFSNR